MKIRTTSLDVERAADASTQESAALDRLSGIVKEILSSPADLLMALAVRKAIDLPVDPIIVAKRLLVGDRDGGGLYRLMVGTVQVDAAESACDALLSPVWRTLADDRALLHAGAGAAFLVANCKVPRDVVIGWVSQSWPVRPRRHDSRGMGAVDIQGGIDVLAQALATKHPVYAPMVHTPFSGGR